MASTTSSQPLKDAISPSILKQSVDKDSLAVFQQQMLFLLEPTNTTKDEEHIKNILSDVLKKIYYDDKHALNTKERIDLAIFADTSPNSTVEVIIEAKKIGSKEMPKDDDINCKALHELMLYFLRERSAGNTSIKHLIITDTVQWYVFDAKVFEKHIYENKPLRKKFTEIDDGRASGNKTSVFYEVADKFVADLPENTLEHVFLNLRDYETDLREFIFQDPKPADPEVLATYEQRARDLNALYWFFSPEHLLKKPPKNDSNSLNKPFYDELLHIIGLTEVKDGGKKVITRCPEGERHYASLLESTINVLQSQGELRRQDVARHYGDNEDEQLFGVALELVVTWLNRVLFLKLLEAQLISYHDNEPNKDQYAFLNSQRIPDTQTLNTLFFNVLAMPQSERQTPFREMFAAVPYLNSSLFEATKLERDMFTIATIAGGYPLPLYKRTVLKDANGKRLEGERPTLAYLLQFLDAYKFSSEGENPVTQDKKTLINASVLGLIFEKLNGYQDGSFFTPGFITMYMCRESLRRAVVQKFNDDYGWTCQTLIDVYNNIRDKPAANALINSLKICDPAVGSGHFLVSALNELIAIKSELGILQDDNGRVLRDYSITVENDELIIKDDNGGFFAYNPNNPESQRVQETLFREKQTLIENCLFGVDINPNSVKICRLRLWIELLKHAYYKQAPAGTPRELETLPNIDINIKTGNSLISRFGLDANIGTLLKTADWDMPKYRDAVKTYRNAASKAEKRQMEALIDSIERNFEVVITNNDPDVIKLEHLQNKLATFDQSRLFDVSKAEQAEFEKTQKAITALEAKLETRRNNPIYDNAFEWRFRFPEVLDDDGNFVGFDVIIGNPPYIRLQELKQASTDQVSYLKANYTAAQKGNYDIYVVFVEKGLQLLQKHGRLAYILPHKFFNAKYGEPLRGLIAEGQHLSKIIHFGDEQVFKEASTYVCLLFLAQNAQKQFKFVSQTNSLDDLENLTASYGMFNASEVSHEAWSFVVGKNRGLFEKMGQSPTKLGDAVDMFVGLQTSADKVFILDLIEKNDTLIKVESKNLRKELDLEGDFLFPVVSGTDVTKYLPLEERQFILFPYEISDDDVEIVSMKRLQTLCPNTANYLLANRPLLEGRERGKLKDKDWHGYIYLKNMTRQHLPKLCVPRLVENLFATPDFEGKFFLDNVDVSGLVWKRDFQKHRLEYLLGLLNSALLRWYFPFISAPFRGGWLSANKQFLSQLPIRTIDFSNPTDKQHHDDMVKKVKTMLDLHQQKAAGEDVDQRISDLDAEIDALVYALYDLTEDEIAIVEGTS